MDLESLLMLQTGLIIQFPAKRGDIFYLEEKYFNEKFMLSLHFRGTLIDLYQNALQH